MISAEGVLPLSVETSLWTLNVKVRTLTQPKQQNLSLKTLKVVGERKKTIRNQSPAAAALTAEPGLCPAVRCRGPSHRALLGFGFCWFSQPDVPAFLAVFSDAWYPLKTESSKQIFIAWNLITLTNNTFRKRPSQYLILGLSKNRTP